MNAIVEKQYSSFVTAAKAAINPPERARHVVIQVGNATCENAAGSREVANEFQRHIEASGRKDILLRQTGCTGRCSCEPIVGVALPGQAPVKYQTVDREKVHEIFTKHIQGGEIAENLLLEEHHHSRPKYELFFCRSKRCEKVLGGNPRGKLEELLREAGVPVDRARTIDANCFGLCRSKEVGQYLHILVMPTKVVYRVQSENDLGRIVKEHICNDTIVKDLCVEGDPMGRRFFQLYGDVSFFNRQTRIALRNCGIIDPESLDEHVYVGGFSALAKVLQEGTPQSVIQTVTDSKLRGRGGGGYPTGQKWAFTAEQKDEVKYIICNADEGDPGAFMDRSMLESDPFSVIEGMIIAGFAVGAHRGFFYVRAEYPLAIGRLETAIAAARQRNLLGKNILGSGFDFDLEIRLGAGAFVCGEETALIHSIEGLRGEPRLRPPYPAVSGLWGKPTVINNVETFANVPVVLQYGPTWFSQIGSDGSGGTKVFALAGKILHTGLVEVPMGTTLRQIVFDIGGGVPDGKKIKAIQTGGPAGGCLPAKWLDTPVDFDSLAKAGSIMGSGGMIVMDEDDCMVDIARFFLKFSQDESCGKCTPCREGTTRMLEILDRIVEGKGVLEDLDKLERLGKLMQRASLCGLGRAAPNPVLSTLRHYREEYEAHVMEKRCPAGKCRSLIHYAIDEQACVGCTACARACPVSCIHGKAKELHVIDQTKCIRCGQCFQVCRFGAVKKS